MGLLSGELLKFSSLTRRGYPNLTIIRPDWVCPVPLVLVLQTRWAIVGQWNGMMENEKKLTLSHFSARVRGAMRSMILLTCLAIDMAAVCAWLLSKLAPEFAISGWQLSGA